MIFYFSGTGNSLYVAKKLSKQLNTPLISISKEILKSNNQMKMPSNTTFEYTLGDEEPILFVFPVYSWMPPENVLLFMDHLKLINYSNQQISTIITCGENIGSAAKLTKNRLKNNGYILNQSFSVVMPSNYIIIGDVYNTEIKNDILNQVDKKINNILMKIKSNKNNDDDIIKGSVPTLKTYVIGTLFNKHARTTKSFFVEEQCTHCGICERVCNGKTITMENGLPTWGSGCTQCLACINYCPVKAIQYGKKTKSKGRYVNPNITIKEMFLD